MAYRIEKLEVSVYEVPTDGPESDGTLEWQPRILYDHYRIEQMFFDGATKPVNGQLRPDLSRPGLALEFKRSDAKRYEK